jgi:hypothetical protein
VLRHVQGAHMMCKSCRSSNQREFRAEINIHFPGSKNLTKPSVWAFPSLLVCLHCGFTEFLLEKDALVRLRDEDSRHTAENNLSYGT